MDGALHTWKASSVHQRLCTVSEWRRDITDANPGFYLREIINAGSCLTVCDRGTRYLSVNNVNNVYPVNPIGRSDEELRDEPAAMVMSE